MTRSTALTSHAILSTAAAFVCAVGWWRAVEEVPAPPRPTAARPPGARTAPMAHRTRTASGTMSTGSATAPTEGGAAHTAGASTAASTGAHPPTATAGNGALARCPKCGAEIPAPNPIHVTGTVILPGNGVQISVGAAGGPSPVSGVAQRLADLPGATIRDKLKALVDQVVAAVRIPAPDDPAAQQPWQQIQEAQNLMNAVFQEALTQDPVATREALITLFRSTDENNFASAIGSFLAAMSGTEAEKDEFDRLLLDLGNSPRVWDRLKAVGQTSRSESPAVEAWWSRTLQNDPDPWVRATAAGSPPSVRTDAVRDSLLRAAQYDPASNVRVSAIYAVGSNPTQTELRTLLDIMRNDRETAVQQEVLDGTAWNASIRDTEIRDALLDIAQNPVRDPSLRDNAINALLWGTNGGDGFIQDPTRRKELQAMEEHLWDEPSPEGE